MINTPKSSIALQLWMARLQTGHPVEMSFEMTPDDVMDRIVVWDSLGAHTGHEAGKQAKRQPRNRMSPGSHYMTPNEYNTPKR